MLRESDIMTDAEVAELVRMHVDTFQKRCVHGFKPGEPDMMAADPETFGNRRIWLRSDVERVLREKVRVPYPDGTTRAAGSMKIEHQTPNKEKRTMSKHPDKTRTDAAKKNAGRKGGAK